MKRFLTAAALVCAVALAAMAAALPNYAGTWVLDKDKTEGLPPQMAGNGMEWAITQDDKMLKLKLSDGNEFSYNMDGSKSKAQLGGRMPGEATVYMEKKDDGKVVLHLEREMVIQGKAIILKIVDTLEQTDGGKGLKVQRHIESPRGPLDMTLVFNKKA